MLVKNKLNVVQRASNEIVHIDNSSTPSKLKQRAADYYISMI